MGLAVAFWILAVIAVLAALGVVAQKNVFRAALLLIVCLISIAGIYVTLNADFMAAAQILIYVGAISVVIILAIMLTREYTKGSPSNRLRIPALITAVAIFVVLTFSVVNTSWNQSAKAPVETTTSAIGLKLFGEGGFILPVEIAAVMLLAVIVGAVVIARDKEE